MNNQAIKGELSAQKMLSQTNPQRRDLINYFRLNHHQQLKLSDVITLRRGGAREYIFTQSQVSSQLNSEDGNNE
ncbi:MAG: hypothetical protein KJ600_03685 [Nanoarchaeota archaeon]|nr:hypothetical protein [Nanoarchaeota archaeon]MBU1103629.1 hypothetical protein [Nanoarchaeota archaeon]